MILVKRSCVVVEPYEWDYCEVLQYWFSIFDISTHSYSYKGMYYDAEKKRLFLPRGIDIRKVERVLRERAVISKEYDEYESTGKMMIKYLPKNETQKEAIRFILGLSEYSYTVPYSQLSVNLMTGKGKTYIAIASLAYLESRFIMITVLTSWIAQWKDKILEYTDLKKKDIKVLTATDMARIYNGNLDPMKYKVFLTGHSAIHSFANKFGWESVGIVFKKLKIQVKVFDENHLNFDNCCMIDFYTNTYKTLYLTATPRRSDPKENRIFKMYFEQVPNIELFNKEEDAKVKCVCIHFTSHPTPMVVVRCRFKYGLNKVEYMKWLQSRETYWKMIYVIFCEAILNMVGSCLLLVEYNNWIPMVKEWIEMNFPEFIGRIGTFHGDTPENEREIAKQQKIIITNRMCGGTCMDSNLINIVFPLAAPVKSDVIAQQMFGRTGREGMEFPNMLYIDLVDEGFKKLKEFYANRNKVFMKYATECSDIVYRDMDIEARYQKYKRLRSIPPWSIKIPAKIEPVECPWRINLGDDKDATDK